MAVDAKVDAQTEEQKELVKNLMNQFEAAQKERQLVEGAWETIKDYVMPSLLEVKGLKETTPGEYGEKIYTSEPINALRLASDGILGYLMPRTSRWVRMTPEDKRFYELPGVRKYYEDATEALHAELNRSNFYGEMTPILDIGHSIGTSTVWIEEDEYRGTVNLISIDPKEVFVATDKYNYVDTWYRHFRMTGKQLLERFPDSLDKKTEEKIKKNPYEKHAVLHCVYKRDKRLHERIDAKNKPIASVYILMDRKALLRESGMDKSKIVTWRYRRFTNSPYGRSPAWDAIHDVVKLNSQAEDLLDASHLAIRPPMTYPQEIADIDISPNGMNPYRIPNRPIQPIQTLGNYPIGRDREEALERSIKNHFHTEFYLILSQSDKTRTAYEVSEISGERAAILQAVVGSIESELLDPMLEIIFRQAAQAGRMPTPPDALFEAGGDEYKWEYMGPLAQLQKRHHGQRTRTQILQEAIPVIEMWPESAQVIKSDELMREILLEGGMSTDLVRSKEELDIIREEIQRRQEAQMAGQAQLEATKAAGGPKAPEPGSAAEQLLGGGGATPADL